jgi:nucleoside-diphosphate-sugar epimerase
MRVLVVGGSGYVAGLTLPLLARDHTLRVYDRRPPAHTEWEYVEGQLEDWETLSQAAHGMDALLFMAMGSNEGWGSVETVRTGFDVSVKGLYFALRAAHEARIAHAVYTSSMSVYHGSLEHRYFPDEDLTPDATDFYGFTKLLGEHVCRNATRDWGMSVNALRLCLPTPAEKWMEQTRAGTPTIATTGDDVARALLGALEYRGNGFQAFMISGDYEQKIMNMSKAKRLLGWEPQARPVK